MKSFNNYMVRKRGGKNVFVDHVVSVLMVQNKLTKWRKRMVAGKFSIHRVQKGGDFLPPP
jgi:hypothetical protein